jgi:peptide/nickel transport system ATP-binding protein
MNRTSPAPAITARATADDQPPAPEADGRMPSVDVRDLDISFDGVSVVQGLSLRIEEGRCVALVGESGSGKTMTCCAMLGLVPPTGTVSASRLDLFGQDGRDLDDTRWQRIRGSEIGLISQDALVSLDPLRRVGAEIEESLVIHARRRRQPLSRSARRRAAVDALAGVSIPDPEHRARQCAHQLSGGQRQRALVASATVNRPRLLIADEPTTALDVAVQKQVLELLGGLVADGTGLLLISHDLAVVSRIADTVLVMKQGRVVESGPTAQVLSAPQHEYTRSLLAAEPSLHPRGTRLSDTPRLDLVPGPHPPGPGTGDQEPLLSVRDVVKTFPAPGNGRITAVGGVSVDVRPGQTLGIVGESGSGKSTLARLVLGLEDPDAGSVLLDGQPWSGVPERRRRPRRGLVQAVYQDPLSSFDPRARVGAILREALALNGVPRGQRADRAEELAQQVGLDGHLLRRRPIALSGGQRQRVAIARALARRPRLLVCDEPVSALDVSIQAQVLDVFADVQEQLGVAMIFISHDLGVVRHLADDILVMKSGDVVERGEAEHVFSAPIHPYTRELLASLPGAQLRKDAR